MLLTLLMQLNMYGPPVPPKKISRGVVRDIDSGGGGERKKKEKESQLLELINADDEEMLIFAKAYLTYKN